jgi:hypothetical protein
MCHLADGICKLKRIGNKINACSRVLGNWEVPPAADENMIMAAGMN